MSEHPKRHHFLPKMSLKRFACEKYIWVYDRQGDSYTNPPIEDVAVIKNYYRYLGNDGEYHYDLEGLLSGIESDASVVIDKLEAFEPMSVEEKERIATYAAFQRVRVPEHAARVHEMREKTYHEMNKRMFRSKHDVNQLLSEYEAARGEKVEVEPEDFLRIIRNEELGLRKDREFEIGAMLTSVVEIIPRLMQMEWKVVFAPSEGAFLTSDNPFVLFPPSTPSPYRGVGIATPGAVKLLPLSRGMYLAFFDEGYEVKACTANRTHCRFVNDHIALNANRFVYSHSRELLASVVNRTKLKDQPKRERISIN